MFSVFRSVFLLLYLLLEMVLFTSAALIAKERQRDVAARVEVPTRVLSGAADEAPQPPQNLVVDSQSDTSIMLTWQAPSDTTDFDHYAVYVEGEDMDDTTPYHYYIFYNLEACTDYTLGVMSVSAAGDTSDPLLGEGQTEVGAPPAPQNLQVDGYTSTTVTLSWDRPDTLCDVEEYRVRWTDTQSTTTSETSSTVTGLSENTAYIFSVFASTSYGEGPEVTVEQTTDVSDGGPPENLVAVGVSSSAINVSWSPAPDEPLYYLVFAMPCMPMEDMVFGLSYQITGMDPCESCEIYVTSYYDDTTKYTANVEGTTDGDDPPPPESCSVQVEEGELAVTWEKPVSECSLDTYNIHWTGTKLWGDEGKVSGNGTASGTVTRYYVSDPVPYSQYTFEISASIDGVFGSPASCSGTSIETQPGPPVILAVDSVQGEAVVTWETPVEENGLIANYGIFVDEATDPQKTVTGDMHSTSLELEPCKTFGISVKAKNGAGWGLPSEVKDVTVVDDDDGAPDPPQNLLVDPQEGGTSVFLYWQPPSDITDVDHYLVYVEEEGMEYNVSGNYYFVENLEACTNYTFGVMSVSVEGDMSDPILGEAQTLVGAAPAPQNLKVDAFTSTTVTLSWDKPDLQCDVEEYRVNWSKDDINTQTMRTNETSFSVTELSINTTYTFTVAGITSYTTGAEATVQQTTAVFDGGPPVNLVAVGISMSEINVSWSPPAYEPSYYVVTAPPCVYLEELVFGLSYLITGLDPCQSCSIYVTSYYNDSFQFTAETIGTSQEGDPVPPENCSVQVEESALTVIWEKPDTACGLGAYRVDWTNTKLWGNGEVESGGSNTTATNISVVDPVPYSEYLFNVSSSINGVIGKQSASCSGTSLEAPASPPTELLQVAMDVSSVTVQWSLPESLRGRLLGWYLNWTSAIGHYLGEQAVTSPEERMLQIGDLDPSEVYNVYIMAVNGAGKGELAMLETSTEYVP